MMDKTNTDTIIRYHDQYKDELWVKASEVEAELTTLKTLITRARKILKENADNIGIECVQSFLTDTSDKGANNA